MSESSISKKTDSDGISICESFGLAWHTLHNSNPKLQQGYWIKMMVMKKLILSILLIYFCNGIDVSSQPLQGKVGIDVKAQTKPLDPSLWKGNFFDEKAATALLKDESVCSTIWKKIPEWQAGEWESTQSTNTKALKYINGQPYAKATKGVYTSKNEMTLGQQKDKNGDIWEPCNSGYWTEAEHDDYINHAFIKFAVPGADEYPDLYGESIHICVDKSTNKITDVYQSKAWTRYVYLSPGLFKEEEVHTAYNEKGEPDVTAWNTNLERRTRTFAENEIRCSHVFQRLQQDFFNYLKNNGFADLIPTGADAGIKEAAAKIMSAPTH